MILGGGFGGVACAIRLNKLMKQRPTLLKDFNIILVDKKNYHLYTPALYEVASSAADDGAPLRNADQLGIARVAVVDEDGRAGHVTSASSAEKSTSRRSSPSRTYHSNVWASPAASV